MGDLSVLMSSSPEDCSNVRWTVVDVTEGSSTHEVSCREYYKLF